MTVSDQIKAN